MGYDAYAVAVIGVRHAPGVIKSKIFHTGTKRACKHEIKEGMKFCPECGVPAYTEFPMPSDEYVDGEGDGDKLCGFDLMNRGEGYYDDPEFIAWWTSGRVPRGQTISCNPIDMKYAREEMREKLEPLGLWDEMKFGTHVFLHESC